VSDTRVERKLLQRALSLLRSEDPGLKKQRLQVIALYVAGVAILAPAYLLTAWGKVDPRFGILLAAIGGNFVAIAAYTAVAIRQWPMLKPHLRRETIEERLREMET
jgi:hypothetical protein